LKHSQSKAVTDVFGTLRLVIVGLLAAAAIMLMSKENFGDPSESVFTFLVSLTIFFMSFVGTRLYKIHPIIIILLCGLAGLVIY
jgi:chromate transporter